jgi:hypothetical protein
LFSEREIRQTDIVQKIETHILCLTDLFNAHHGIYKIMCENMIEPEKPQTQIQYNAENIRFARRITEATMQTHIHKK